LPTWTNASFTTRNYLATDRLETAPDKMLRYRVQGALRHESESKKSKWVITWDKYSDVRMPGDFKSEDFEVNTAQQTLFYTRHQGDEGLISFKCRPRVNSFESIRQDLPSLYAALLPQAIGASGIYHFFRGKVGYVSFAYSDKLKTSIPDFQSGRLDVRESLFRPIGCGPLMITPYGSVNYVFYTTSPSHRPRSALFFGYGLDLTARGIRSYGENRHTIEPYIRYTALTRPSTRPDRHYIFSIADGFNEINQIRFGIRNRWNQEWTIDAYANAFFSDPTIPQWIPRLYLTTEGNWPSLATATQVIWNFRNQVLDVATLRIGWTLSENAAIAVEGRYRSQYDWRKADHDNFILDTTRSQADLLDSPLSDRRVTLLSHLFLRLTPFWECHIQSHHGFYRADEKPYNEVKVDLFTWISAAWKLRLSYSHTDKDDRVTAGVSLVKK
ncbi:MAG: hypothetical protein RL235_863, partial [Chlamydiota bacterium]